MCIRDRYSVVAPLKMKKRMIMKIFSLTGVRFGEHYEETKRRLNVNRMETTKNKTMKRPNYSRNSDLIRILIFTTATCTIKTKKFT